MSLIPIDCTITTYDFAAGYLVDVVDYHCEETLDIYLHHAYLSGVKVHVLQIRKDELGYGGAGRLENIIESRLLHSNYIKKFQKNYPDAFELLDGSEDDEL